MTDPSTWSKQNWLGSYGLPDSSRKELKTFKSKKNYAIDRDSMKLNYCSNFEVPPGNSHRKADSEKKIEKIQIFNLNLQIT